MFNSFARKLRALASGAVLMVAAGLSSPSLASDLSNVAQDRMTDAPAVIEGLAASPDGRVPVIVEFLAPEVPALAAASAERGSEDADAALTAAVHGAQDAILGRVLDLPETGTLSAADAEALNIKRMDFTPMFAILTDAALLERLAADPDVARIHLDGLNEFFLRESLPRIGMPAAYAAGGTGSDWHVAVIDSGGRRAHEFLNRQIVSAACYSTNDPSRNSTSICPGGVERSTNIASADDCDANTILGCGHGTHVAGTAAGFNLNPNGTNPDSGVARDARIISIGVGSLLPRSSCGSIPSQYTGGCLRPWNSDILLGLERAYALRNAMSIAAVNMSLGGGLYSSACDDDARKPIIDQLRAAGIATVVAAGNNGNRTSISAPACVSSAIAIASAEQRDALSPFSNANSLIDLVAPGSGIVSSYVDGNRNNQYQALSGTSMAAPHVAGAFAALRSAQPDASVDEILSALQGSGTHIFFGGALSRMRINVDRALTLLREGIQTTTTLSGPSESREGRSVTFTAAVAAADGSRPSGAVEFYNGDTVLARRDLEMGTAIYTTSFLPMGTHTISARYEGSQTHFGSQSNVINHRVTGETVEPPVNDNFADAIQIPGPGTYNGTNVGATAEPGEPQHASRTGNRNSVWWYFTPTGTDRVTIDTDGSNFDTVLAVYTGSAVNALTLIAENDDALGIGLRSRVQFDPQPGTTYRIAVAGHGVSTGSIVLNVAGGGAGAAAPTTTSLNGPATSDQGQSVTFAATVSSASGTPSGAVTFRRGNTTIGTASLSSGRAALTISTLPVGSHQITAAYSGTANHLTSVSPPLTHVVSGTGPADVEVSLSVPGGIVRPGAPARLMAEVTSDTGTPSGMVRFSADGTTLGNATLSNGRATLSAPLPVGRNTVIAHYAGTATHNAGESPSRMFLEDSVLDQSMTTSGTRSRSRRVSRLSDIVKPFTAVVEQRRNLGQLVERVDAELHHQQVGGLVVNRARLTVGERFGDEPPAEQRAHDRVDVDGANRRNRAAADGLLVGNDGEGLECRLRQLRRVLRVHEVAHDVVEFGAHVNAPASADLAQFEAAARPARLTVEVGDEFGDRGAHLLHRAPDSARETDDALWLVHDHEYRFEHSVQLTGHSRLPGSRGSRRSSSRPSTAR